MNDYSRLCCIVSLLVAFSTGAFADEPGTVMYFDHSTVDDSFANGLSLLTNDHYKVITGRRVEPGQVEIHEHDTDIIYVTDGAAIMVVGGTGEKLHADQPGEIRGTSIKGGTTHHLAKGDIIVIPKGTPHWITEVGGTFLYLVVKVTE